MSGGSSNRPVCGPDPVMSGTAKTRAGSRREARSADAGRGAQRVHWRSPDDASDPAQCLRAASRQQLIVHSEVARVRRGATPGAANRPSRSEAVSERPIVIRARSIPEVGSAPRGPTRRAPARRAEPSGPVGECLIEDAAQGLVALFARGRVA